MNELLSWMPQVNFTVAMAAVATIGYLFGRRRKRPDETIALKAQREIERAQSVASELERIGTAVRKHLAKHHASVARFKERVNDLTSHEEVETWKMLCEEADEFLKPTLRLAHEFAQAYDQLRQQMTHLMAFTEVRTDPLTGVRNRRALDEVLAGMFAMKTRYDQEFSIVIFDIDYFKRVNDEQGHLTGDRVLRTFATLLNDSVRETDVVARYGGEEFVIIMPQTNLESATAFCERLRAMVERNAIVDIKVTVSGGVATAHDGDDVQSLLNRADEALYHAKESGRNRIFRHDGTHIDPVPAGAAQVGVGV